MENKRILVTGGAGFIGGHLCEALSQKNSVFSLDNYFIGSQNNHVPSVLEYTNGGTYCRQLLRKYENYDLDYIYHLGEYSRVEQSFDDYKKVFKYNLTGTRNVVELAKKTGAKLIYAGSSTKFADETPDYIQSPYAWSKKINTELVNNCGKWFGMDYAITYFYNAYGPRELAQSKYATLIGIYTKAMQENRPLSVVSPGTQVRNFTYVKDIVAALELIGEFGQGDEYGIGSDTAYSVLDVAKMFGGEIQYLPARRGNRLSASVITEKTKQLGWTTKMDLETYIKGLSI